MVAPTVRKEAVAGRAHFYLCAGVVALALVLGGGTRVGLAQDVIIQLAAIPLATSCVLELGIRQGATRVPAAVLAFCAAAILLPLAQTVPLPPAVWTSLPGQDLPARALEAAGLPATWRSLSLSPNATWTSALALLPPMSVFFATLLLSYPERRKIAFLILAIGLASALLGLLQIAQGPESPLRLYEFTSPTEAVGFFANRNHFSAFVYSLILLVGAWTASALPAGETKGGKAAGFQTEQFVPLAIAFVSIVALVGAQLMARSRAGAALTMIALIGVFAIFASKRHVAANKTPARVLLFATLLGLMFSTQFALYRFIERFERNMLDDARIQFAADTWTAIRAFFPTGSGLGTFVPVYAAFEKKEHAIPGVYANHAHNDLLELALETGLPGLILTGLFLVWLVRCVLRLWREAAPQRTQIDTRLTQAAALIVALLLLHSLVDYPLRTTALATLFAFSCALQFAPPKSSFGSAEQARRNVPEAFERPRVQRKPTRQFVPAAQAAEFTQWQNGTEWPEAWREKKSEGHNQTDQQDTDDTPSSGTSTS